MEIVTSKTNKIIKFAVSLKQKKYREENGYCLIEGVKILQEAIKNNIEVLHIFVSKDVSLNLNIKTKITVVTDDIISYLSTVPSPQGVVSMVKIKKNSFRLPKTNFLVLDNLQDPSNMGSVIRTAAATNFTDIYMINCCDIFNEKVIRSSMGNLFKCNFFDIDYPMVDLLKDNLFIADMSGKNIFEFGNFKHITGICIGNEGHGVSADIRNKTSNYFSIPMLNDVESLNAGVSAGIIMYHIKLNQKE